MLLAHCMSATKTSVVSAVCILQHKHTYYPWPTKHGLCPVASVELQLDAYSTALSCNCYASRQHRHKGPSMSLLSRLRLSFVVCSCTCNYMCFSCTVYLQRLLPVLLLLLPQCLSCADEHLLLQVDALSLVLDNNQLVGSLWGTMTCGLQIAQNKLSFTQPASLMWSKLWSHTGLVGCAAAEPF